MTELIVHNTPVEEYRINSRAIFVKREDKSTVSPPMPALAKMRGASVLLAKLKAEGAKKVGVFDTRVSRAGDGIACLCKELGLECYVGYANMKSGLSENLESAFANGGIPLPVKPGRTPICYALAKREMKAMGGYMLPQGLVCAESADAVAREANSVPTELLGGSVVACTGTGTIISGICMGLPILPLVYGISTCISIKKQLKNINAMISLASPERKYQIQQNLTLVPQFMDYYERCEIEIPFPCSPYYDAKSWKWMLDNLDVLKDPILFYNIGQK